MDILEEPRWGARMLSPDRARFSIWAPDHKFMCLALGDRVLDMEAEADGLVFSYSPRGRRITLSIRPSGGDAPMPSYGQSAGSPDVPSPLRGLWCQWTPRQSGGTKRRVVAGVLCQGQSH
jgi:hypothetical protein